MTTQNAAKISGIPMGKSNPCFSIHDARCRSKAAWNCGWRAKKSFCFACQSRIVMLAPTTEGKISNELAKATTGRSVVENQGCQVNPAPREMANAVTRNDCEVTYQVSRLAIN